MRHRGAGALSMKFMKPMKKKMPALSSLSRRGPGEGGFTLIEMIVVVLLLSIAMLGILAVFDASARINKSESDVADAQGNVRFGIYQMTRAIRMAGAGGLYVTQAVLNAPDPQLAGITVGSATGYDNVTGASVQDLNTGLAVPVRNGTDMIEIRGVINSPLLAFDLSTTCPGNCTGIAAINVPLTVYGAFNQPHVNENNANRPQFEAIDTYTLGVTAARPMFVIVTKNDDIHPACSTPASPQIYSQPTYNVGLLTAPTTLIATSTFGTVNFADGSALEFNQEVPAETGAIASSLVDLRSIGVLDDLIYFIDNTDPNHPALAQGTRRGTQFDVVHLADDVEDMQIAYGVDTDGNNAINRLVAPAGRDTDTNVSTAVNGDEWAPNVPGEAPYVATDFQSQQPPPASFEPHDKDSCHAPRLHGVMISLIAKSKDPDPNYKSSSALGYRTMNSPVTVNPPYPDVAQYPTISAEPHFRRRVQTLKINLRNYAYPG
jgi:prepilin-type N-terminal cleavage/methylation domain-containing protein